MFEEIKLSFFKLFSVKAGNVNVQTFMLDTFIFYRLNCGVRHVMTIQSLEVRHVMMFTLPKFWRMSC